MKQKLINYLFNLPRYMVWGGIITLSIIFWLLVVFGIAFILLIHQVRSEIMGFFDRTFHRILLCLNHYIF